LNFFSENLIFEESANKQLAQVRHEFQQFFAQINQNIFFVEPQNEEMTLASIQSTTNAELLEFEIRIEAGDGKGISTPKPDQFHSCI